MSIIEIAKKAGVGVGTVSRYFNTPDKVSLKSTVKIRKAMECVNYNLSVRRPGPKTPDRVGVKTGVIVFLTLGGILPEHVMHPPVFPILMTGIQKAISESNMTMMYASMKDDEPVPDLIDKRFCDGVILLGAIRNKAQNKKLHEALSRLPAVWCFRIHSDPKLHFDHIFYDNSNVAKIAVEHLHSRGHRSIAFFNTNRKHDAFQQREENFLETARSHGMKTTVFSSENPVPEDAQIELAAQFLNQKRDISGAFFCSDENMLGICQELRIRGFDLHALDSVGCNNDTVFLRYIRPTPATIDLNLIKVGETAVRQLRARINNKGEKSTIELKIAPDLIIP